MSNTEPEEDKRRTVPGVFLPEREFFTDAAGPELRERIITDMRTLANFLEEHPQLPISPHTSVEVTYFPRTESDQAAIAEVVEAGSHLGRIPAWEGDHYLVEHHHGAGRYRVVAIPARVRARYRSWLTYSGHVRQD
ncbi:hypothetical protein [Nocardiopsis sp. JB363]|uniref:hypothetical protein n=1 Tax=Nocardiopsis sp. JB363 TaxID=1434837 RepID=UPI00097AACCE|nr:hypothetical protein [Nocardiopsis sp. JB363]SIO89586.1 hypothetical protein BQ8420_22340 [Nocardiopsis sp. JB363]